MTPGLRALACSLVLGGAGLPRAAWASADAFPTPAPLNPEFVKYQQSRKALKAAGAAPAATRLGYAPPPIDRSYMTGARPFAPGPRLPPVPNPLPSTYDLRTLSYVTPVRDQGTCGSCWTFATYGSLESVLLESPAQTWDFSENHMKDTAGFDWGACGGGNFEIATAYLTRQSGPVSAADDPYSATSSVSPSNVTVRKHVKDVLYLPDRANSTDNTTIKTAMMTYGAVGTDIYWVNGSYNAVNHAYYDSSLNAINHSVALIGWDDNYAAGNFTAVPAGNGAFIAKNSWGTSWGVAGYFYISYYDTHLLDNTVFDAAQDPVAGEYVYQYDPFGRTADYGYSPAVIGWLANIFTATGFTETLQEVGFYTTDVNTAYEVRVYTNSGGLPRTGSLVDTKTGSFSYAGYHAVAVGPVSLQLDERFAVVVKLTNATYVKPIAVEALIPGYDSSASASAGQSYVSPDGITWTDMTAVAANANVCVKAYTGSRVDIPPNSQKLSTVVVYPNPADLSKGAVVKVAKIPIDSVGTTISIYTLSGRLVRTLTEGAGIANDPGLPYKAGTWDGSNISGERVASGVYVYVIRTQNRGSSTGRIGILR